MIHVDPANLPSSPASAGATAADAPAPASRALIEQHLAMLTRLAEMGMAIAEAATRAATAPPAPDGAADGGTEAAFRGDPTLAYTRAARAVRLTLALQGQLLKDLAALEKGEAKDAYDRKIRRRKGLARRIDEALHDERPEAAGWEFQRLATFTYERLVDGEDEEDTLDRPFAEIVARICADLALSPEATAEVVALAQPPSPSGLSRGPMGPSQDGSGPCVGGLDPRDKPEDDGEEDSAAPRPWPPPSG